MESKKLLVCDYDGSYCLDKNDDCMENNFSINKFIELGNVFMISTGRSFEDFVGEFIKKSIPGQYFCCCNGNAVFDNKMRLLRFKTIKLEKLKELKKYSSDIEWIDFYDSYGIEDRRNIVECKLRYKNINVKDKILRFINDSGYFTYYHQIDDSLLLHLFDSDDKKIGSIEYVSDTEKINKKNIFVYGDGYNDIDMIKTYNGFAFSKSKDIIKKYSLGMFDSVSELSKRIIDNEVPIR